jgi:hypothetical protein
VLFGSSSRLQTSQANIRFYSPRLFQNLYTVNVAGGKANLLRKAELSLRNTTKAEIRSFSRQKRLRRSVKKTPYKCVTRDI